MIALSFINPIYIRGRHSFTLLTLSAICNLVYSYYNTR